MMKENRASLFEEVLQILNLKYNIPISWAHCFFY